MISIKNYIADPEVLLAMSPEDLAGPLMECLNAMDPAEVHSQLHRSNCVNAQAEPYPQNRKQEIAEAIMEAWMWLEREGMLAPRPGIHINGEWMFITKRGKSLKNSIDLKSFLHGNLLPKHQLHPLIATKAWSAFVRGEYDTAVFQAFKEVEVAVRRAGSFSSAEIGVPLMRKAFHPSTGPLADKTVMEGERQALADLFAGSIGSYKNPHSHRSVPIEAHEAVEMITLASHLLRIVDTRTPSLPIS